MAHISRPVACSRPLSFIKSYEAQVLLRNGTKDLPRMTKILENERVRVVIHVIIR